MSYKGFKETDTHIYFYGSIYSNFTSCKNLLIDFTKYTCTEQYFMAKKATLFGDYNILSQIMHSTNPAFQKQLGRMVEGFNPEIWDEHKYYVMCNAVYAKFSQNEDFKTALLATGNKSLVEGSPSDKVWGVGIHYESPDILDEKNWKGENLLGLALMDARDKLRGRHNGD